MQELVDRYAAKLVAHGLCDEGRPLIGGLDADLVWNRPDPARAELEKVFAGLNINSLLFARPAEPYWSIIEHLARSTGDVIEPNDSETRTFMHDLPIVRAFEAGAIVAALKQRKSAIIPGRGVVTWGTVSPEQAFVFFSSVCFACFVKFFSDYLADAREDAISPEQQRVFDRVVAQLEPLPEESPCLAEGPFRTEEEVYHALCEVGRATVGQRLVDSFFGNVSFRLGGMLYISQTGSSLDELEGCIDPCPLDGSSCAAITASSEFGAHREVIEREGVDGILHGHPKFSVILSMDCDMKCDLAGQCHIRCPEERFIEDIPVVPGEVGAGPYGLCNTLPAAIKGRRGVIVYGHGLFTVARTDFNDAFAELLAVERMCREIYFRRVGTGAA